MNLDTVTFVLVATVPFFAGSVWALVDAAQKDFGSISRKTAWVLVAGIPFVGFIIYLLFGFRRGRKMP